MVLHKGIIYYTDSRLNGLIYLMVQESILESGLPIVSCSLKPIDFGKNIVVDSEPSMMTLFRQILKALENSNSDYIFFCEHDVLYHKSHFDFTPSRDDTYYYNTNVWRWDYPKDRFISYDGLKSLSGMCCNRELAINHYRKRLDYIERMKYKDGRDPDWARKMGYEPGKSLKRGGFLEETTENWRSEFPIIDIRHKGVLTPKKVTLDSFKHLPIGWKETRLTEIPYWNLRKKIYECQGTIYFNTSEK